MHFGIIETFQLNKFDQLFNLDSIPRGSRNWILYGSFFSPVCVLISKNPFQYFTILFTNKI